MKKVSYVLMVFVMALWGVAPVMMQGQGAVKDIKDSAVGKDGSKGVALTKEGGTNTDPNTKNVTDTFRLKNPKLYLNYRRNEMYSAQRCRDSVIVLDLDGPCTMHPTNGSYPDYTWSTVYGTLLSQFHQEYVREQYYNQEMLDDRCPNCPDRIPVYAMARYDFFFVEHYGALDSNGNVLKYDTVPEEYLIHHDTLILTLYWPADKATWGKGYSQTFRIPIYDGARMEANTYGDYHIEGETLVRYNGDSSNVAVPADKGITAIGPKAFYEYAKGPHLIRNVWLPEGITSIGEKAFVGCTNLEHVYIPDGLTVIGDSAFAGCAKLQGLTIPSSVDSIGLEAFVNCPLLEEVAVRAITPPKIGSSPISPGLFFRSDTTLTLHIPAPSMEDYEVATGWIQYASKMIADIPVRFDTIVSVDTVIMYDTSNLVIRDTTWRYDTTWIFGDNAAVIVDSSLATLWQHDTLEGGTVVIKDTLYVTLNDTLSRWDTIKYNYWGYDTVWVTSYDTVIQTVYVHDTVNIADTTERVIVIDNMAGVEAVVEAGYLRLVPAGGADLYYIEGLEAGKAFAIYNITGRLVYRGATQPVYLPARGLFIVGQEGKYWKFVR